MDSSCPFALQDHATGMALVATATIEKGQMISQISAGMPDASLSEPRHASLADRSWTYPPLLSRSHLLPTPTARIAEFKSKTPTKHTVELEDGEHWQILPEPLRFLQHSCDPNAALLRGHPSPPSLVALRPIARGELITFNYLQCGRFKYPVWHVSPRGPLAAGSRVSSLALCAH